MWSGFLHSQLVFDSFCSQLLPVLPLYLSIASLSRNELRKVCLFVLLLRLLFICPPPLFSDHVLSSAQLGYALELPATPTCQLLRISPENNCHLSHPKTAPQNKRRMPAVQFQLFKTWPKRVAAAIRCKAALSFPALTT